MISIWSGKCVFFHWTTNTHHPFCTCCCNSYVTLFVDSLLGLYASSQGPPEPTSLKWHDFWVLGHGYKTSHLRRATKCQHVEPRVLSPVHALLVAYTHNTHTCCFHQAPRKPNSNSATPNMVKSMFYAAGLKIIKCYFVYVQNERSKSTWAAYGGNFSLVTWQNQ